MQKFQLWAMGVVDHENTKRLLSRTESLAESETITDLTLIVKALIFPGSVQKLECKSSH